MTRADRPTSQRPCTGCGTPCKAEKGLCRRCRDANPKRPQRICPSCGVTTTAKSGICLSCRNGHLPTVVNESHALTGGRWRRHGLVYVWDAGTDESEAA